MGITEEVIVHDMQLEVMTRIKVSKEIEIIISNVDQTGTLFLNDYDLEFYFNAKTAKIISKMIDSNFGNQIMLMQLLRVHEIKDEFGVL